MADDPVADDPVAEDQLADDPVADDPVADDPVADDPLARERRAAPPDPAANPVLDIVAGSVLAALALFALLWLIPNHTGRAADANDLSPGFFPRLAAVAVLAMAVMLVAHRTIRFRRLRQDGTAGGGLAVLTEIGIWLVACVAISAGLSLVGFLAVSPLVIAVAMVAAGERRWWLIGLIAAGVSAVSYVGAEQIFDVILP